jgi:hypothetical protein
MSPSEIRAELLAQHAALREMIKVTRRVAEAAQRGEAARDELEQEVIRLGQALGRHNLREEELLRSVILGEDAWGWARGEIMTAAHVHEHEEIYAALRGVPATLDEFAGAGVQMLLDRVLEHMALEERAFLTEDALRVVDTGSASG